MASDPFCLLGEYEARTVVCERPIARGPVHPVERNLNCTRIHVIGARPGDAPVLLVVYRRPALHQVGGPDRGVHDHRVLAAELAFWIGRYHKTWTERAGAWAVLPHGMVTAGAATEEDAPLPVTLTSSPPALRPKDGDRW